VALRAFGPLTARGRLNLHEISERTAHPSSCDNGPVPEPSDMRMPDTADLLELARSRVASVAPATDLEAMSMCFQLIRAADRIAGDLETVHRRIGWSWAGFRVAFWVWLLGPLEPRQIASLASASRASVSSVLNTLERDGHVVRRRVAGDRRLVKVELTERGASLIVDAFRTQNEREQGWAAALTAEERDTLIALTGRLLDRGAEA
jgi:DNA-binding MarR family transcriptional regulator